MNDISADFHKLHYYFNPDIQISLAKPNRTIVGNLVEAYNTKINQKIGQITELSFSIPYTVEKNFIFTDNKNVDKIKQRFLLKVKYLNNEEWFVITDENDSLNDTNIKNVTAYNLGYQLADKYIRQWAGVFINNEYRKESLNAKQVMDNILGETSWSYDDVNSDALFLTRYRSFDFSNLYRLDAVFNIAETFNAIIEWDTDNKKIIFKDAETYGSFGGLYISDEKYLSSYERNTKSSEMATRLFLYGKDGLTINEINPSGTSYIEDLSYFLKGFNMDDNGNILSHSNHVSDSLCIAIINYQNLVISKDGQFEGLLTQKENYQSQLKEKNNELLTLNNELKAIQVEIDFADSRGLDSTEFKTQETNKKNEITSKESEINVINNNINSVNVLINNLKNEISMENNFTTEQILELDNFTIEKPWENNFISDPKELLELGKKEMEKYNKPNVIYDISIVNLLRIAEAQRDIKRLKLGDKIRIRKKEIEEIVEAQIIEMQIDFDGGGIELTIANFSTNKNDEDELAKLIYNTSVTTSTVNINKNKWDDITSVGNFVEERLNNVWNSAQYEITAGTNENVVFDNRGITITDPSDQDRFLRMTNSAIALTKTGGRSVSLAITPDGVAAEVIIGRLIIGQELYIENEAGKFTFNQDGVTIKNTSFNLISDTGGNGVTINSTDGVAVTKSDNKVRTILNATDGIKVQVKKGTAWNDEFYYDVLNERLIVDGEINARELKVNGNSVLTDGRTKINGLYVTNINADTITSGTINAINITGSIISGSTINGTVFNSSSTDGTKRIKIENEYLRFFSGANENITITNDGTYPSIQVKSNTSGATGYFTTETYGRAIIVGQDNSHRRAWLGTGFEVNGELGDETAGRLALYNSTGNAKVRITSDNTLTSYIMGSLAIGRDTANYKLHVAGTFNATQVYMLGELVATQAYVDQAIANALAK